MNVQAAFHAPARLAGPPAATLGPMYTAADLALAQRHVDEGILRLAEQRIRVEKLVALGHDAGEGRRLLEALEDTLQVMVKRRDEIEDDLRRPGRPRIPG